MALGHLAHLHQHLVVGHDHIAQKHEEGIAVHLLRRAVDRMPQAERLVLVDEGDGKIARMRNGFGVGVLPAPAQGRLQIGVGGEMLFDGLLFAAVDDHDLVGTGSQALFDDVLDDGTVHNQQHFLRNRLGCRQEPRSHARSGDKSLHERTSWAKSPRLRLHVGNAGGYSKLEHYTPTQRPPCAFHAPANTRTACGLVG